MFFKMKNYLGFYVSVVLILSEGCMACFQENSATYLDIKVGDAFYKECSCSVPGLNVDSLRWVDNNGHIIQQGPGIESNIHLERKDKALNLVIRSVSKTMSGTYKCVTNDANGVEHVQTHELSVFDQMEFVDTPAKQYLVEGSNAPIICKTTPVSAIIDWTKGEKEETLKVTGDKYIKTDDGIIVMDVTKDDAGAYKCTAYTAKGDGGDKYIEVEVYTLPKIIDLYAMPEVTVGVGEQLTVKCLAEGWPEPDYSWNKTSEFYKLVRVERDMWTKITKLTKLTVNGTHQKTYPFRRALQSSNQDESRNATWKQVNNTITFNSVGEEDRGTYECTASNVAGTVKKEITIDVLVGPTIINFNNITAIEDADAEIIMFCNTTGNPPPNVTIVYTGKSLTEETDSAYERLIPNSSLLKINRSNEGIYICNASNTVDYEAEIMYLKVLHKPYFKEQRELIWAWNGSTVTLSCAHESSPAAHVTWRFEFSRASFRKENIVDNVVPQILNLGGNIENTFNMNENHYLYGDYTCRAVNEFGDAEKTIELRKGYPPTVVQNASVINVTATSAKFSIETPVDFIGPDVIGFMAEYDEYQNYEITNIHQNRTWSTSRPFRLDKLKPNTTYFVRFAAINLAGTGQWSEMYDFDTLEKSAPEPPIWPDEPLQVISTNKLLRWKAPEDNGDPIDYYKLRYCPIYGELDEKLCKAVDIPPSTELDLNNLEYNTSYMFELKAHNAIGFSAAASTSVVVPAAPLQSASVLSASVIIGISVVVVVVCLLLLDLLLLFWRQQGIIAACCYKKNKKKKTNDLNNSRDKKGLLRDNRETSTDDASRRPNNGHREYEYNKTTGIITGKHSAV